MQRKSKCMPLKFKQKYSVVLYLRLTQPFRMKNLHPNPNSMDLKYKICIHWKQILDSSVTSLSELLQIGLGPGDLNTRRKLEHTSDAK